MAPVVRKAQRRRLSLEGRGYFMGTLIPRRETHVYRHRNCGAHPARRSRRHGIARPRGLKAQLLRESVGSGRVKEQNMSLHREYVTEADSDAAVATSSASGALWSPAQFVGLIVGIGFT